MPSAEWVRKAVHVPGGLLPPAFLYVFGWAGSVAIALFIVAYVVVGWDALRRGVRLPIIAAGILATQRAGERAPAGAVEFMTSILVLGVLFPLPYFLAAAALMAAGDGAAALAGQRWGRRRLPWNRRKSWAGLAAGVLVGLPLTILYAWLGILLMRRGVTVDEPAGPSGPWMAIPAILAAFLLVLSAFRFATSRGWAPRVAQARPAQVVAGLAISLVPALAFLLTVPAFLQAPLLPPLGGHAAATRLLLVVVPVAAMLVESRVNRHDNLWVPGVYAVLAYLVVLVGHGF